MLLSPLFSKLQNRYRPEEVESLLELTRELLARLYAASDNDASKHLMYHGKKFSDDQESSFIRDIYISRMYVEVKFPVLLLTLFYSVADPLASVSCFMVHG